MLFTDSSVFSSYSLCNSVLSVILLKLKWNEMQPIPGAYIINRRLFQFLW